ncbi:ASCH domain-containing protein [Rubinisphaera italica]|uniref:ASCH domain protein n=1 Tax=Rubinisphaera italica TaxID=2527969 RepID=A0A5C5XLB3_9PLAN|nr:ASCH domain-containing protein [Rubinisphaera italica]TWT62935.1 ASCH domain protein [Rubinisphaera italica]
MELDQDRIALGIKQPWAELILRGKKTLEIRSRSTNVRGSIYLYTSKKHATETYAVKAIQDHELDSCDFPLGLIVGSVEIVECRKTTPQDTVLSCLSTQELENRYAWILKNPVRFTKPQPVRFLPYGVWFYPYCRRKESSERNPEK